tara:strand:+ start:14159 stop:15094 length:936 start_codon:yes stop_codon:yes gene_type:complete
MNTSGKPDYWSLLGLSPGSDGDQLKKAFRREARRWHPDLNVNDLNAEERFKLVNEAYVVLSDPRKRTAWEKSQDPLIKYKDPFLNGFPDFYEYLDIALDINVKEKRDQFLENDSFLVEDKYEDQLENNNNYKKDWPTKTPDNPPPIKAFEDKESLVFLTPDEALYGTNVSIELEDGTLVEVFTPPFSGDGWRLRLPSVAEGGRDHFLQLRIQTDEGLRIDGLRVLYRLELFPPDAFLGCAVEVPTLNGLVTLQVPPRSSSGRLLRLRGRGMEFEGERGDMLVEIFVVIPAESSDSEVALYKRLQEISTEEI